MIPYVTMEKIMVELAKITKKDAKEAAMMFLGVLAMWTDCLFDEKAGARLLKIDKESYEGGDVHYDSVPPEVLEEYIDKSNLENSVFVKKIEEIFDFAQTGIETEFESGGFLIDELLEFGSFWQVFNSKSFLCFKDNGINMLNVCNKKGDRALDILLVVIDAAYARWKLLESHNLTLDEISLLAGVGLKTVRNAVSSKGHDRLIVSGREGDNPVVDCDEAYRWLLTKKGFTGPFLYTEEPPYGNYETLAQFRHHCFVLRKLSNLEITDLAGQLSWDRPLTEAYMSLENLTVTENLKLLTPKVLLNLGMFYQSKYLNTFVVEGSRILASVIAELQANELFNFVDL
jgi:hypothetical protein